MSAYVILDTEVTDPDAYARYRELATPALAAYGGKFLVRGGATEDLEGNWSPPRLVVIEFESVEQAKKWYHSDEYAEAKAVRLSASKGNLILAEGI